jgi:hypothetical protein
MFLNAGMPDCMASGQSCTKMNLNADAGIQSGTGMYHYRTEMPDAGMSMPAASDSS